MINLISEKEKIVENSQAEERKHLLDQELQDLSVVKEN